MRERKSRKGSSPPQHRKKNPRTETHQINRNTMQLFNLVFKLLIQDASSVAIIPFINGLFGKSFSPDTKIRVDQSTLHAYLTTGDGNRRIRARFQHSVSEGSSPGCSLTQPFPVWYGRRANARRLYWKGIDTMT